MVISVGLNDAMIDKDQKVIFVHIPKTVGSLITFSLGLRPLPNQRPHDAAATIKTINPELWEKCKTFTVVRNPWEMWVSRYFYKLSNNHNMQINAKTDHLIAMHKGFLSTLSEPIAPYALEGGFLKREYPDSIMNFLTDENGEIIVDKIIRHDSFNVEFPKFCQDNELEVKDVQEKHRNKTDHLHYSHYYTEQWMIDTVYNKNKDYINHFGFSFETQDFIEYQI